MVPITKVWMESCSKLRGTSSDSSGSIFVQAAVKVAHASKSFGHTYLRFGSALSLLGELFVESQHTFQGIEHASCFFGGEPLSRSTI